jgi:transcriptional regulator with XRE-family HTH domain
LAIYQQGVDYALQRSYDESMAQSSSDRPKTFGQRVREFRTAKNLSLRGLAPIVGVGFTYLSKVENGKLDFGDYPSEALIRKLAAALDADLDELFLLAKIVPDRIRSRVMERPEVFRALALCDDTTLDRVMTQIRRRGSVSK